MQCVAPTSAGASTGAMCVKTSLVSVACLNLCIAGRVFCTCLVFCTLSQLECNDTRYCQLVSVTVSKVSQC